jgi:iron complex outermembrane receptor protein
MRCTLHLAGSAVAVLGSVATHAQWPERPSSASQDADILVTAERQSVAISKVPVAVTALDGQTLAILGVSTVSDLGAIVPDLQVNDSTGGTEPNFTLRGIGLGNEYDDNQASPIGVYVDDAYLAFRATHGAQLFDLERVEVLRGPQGTLYGRNTTGGAINFVSRKPSLSGSNGYAELGYGNFDALEAQAAFEATPKDGVLGIRIAGTYARHDGYVKNIFPGAPDLASEDTGSGRLTIRYDPVPELDLLLKITSEKGSQIQPGVLELGTGVDGIDVLSGYGRAGLPFHTVDSDDPHRNRTRFNGVEFTARYDLSDSLSIHDLTAFDGARSLLGQDVDGSPVNLLGSTFEGNYRELNQELRITFKRPRLNVQGGTYYGWDRDTADNQYDFFGFLEARGVPADPNLVAGGGTITQHYTQRRASVAGFGQVDYAVTGRLNLTVGLRYTDDHSSYRDGSASIGDYRYRPLVETVGSPGNPLDKSGRSDALTGRVGLSYTIKGGPMLFGGFSRGYRSGAFNGSGYLSPAQVSYVRPETINAYEIGAKGIIAGSFRYSASLFDYDYRNQQLLDIVGPVGFLKNAGKSSIRGAELEIFERFDARLTAGASVGLLKSRYDQLTLQGFDLAGNRLPFTPSATGSARLEWTVARRGAGSLLFILSGTYSGKVYFSPFNTLNGNGPLHQNGYLQENATLEWSSSTWSARLWVKNISGEKHLVYGNNFTGTSGFYYFNISDPRTIGVALRRTF